MGVCVVETSLMVFLSIGSLPFLWVIGVYIWYEWRGNTKSHILLTGKICGSTLRVT